MNKEFSSKNILKLAWPSMISQGVIILVGMIDLIFIGKFGTLATATVSIANFVCVAIYTFLEGLRSGTTVLIAHFLGAKDKKNITKIFNRNLFFALCIGLSIFILAYPLSYAIYSVAWKFMENIQIKPLGINYLSIRLLAAPFILIFFTITGLFRGLKNAFVPFLITAAICILNATLDYFFIFTNNTTIQMGISGAAIATLIAYIVGAIISVLFLFKHKLTKPYINFKNFFSSIKNKKDVKDVNITSQIGIFSGILAAITATFGYISTTLGPNSFVIFQLTHQAYLTIYFLASGFLVAASIAVGKLIGAKEKQYVIPTVFKISCIYLTIIGTLSLFLIIFSPQLANLLSPTNLLIAKVTSVTFKLVACSLFLSTLYIVLLGALMGAKDTKFILITETITGFLFFIPLAYLFAKHLGLGMIGGYIAFFSWTALDSIIFSWRFYIQKKWLK